MRLFQISFNFNYALADIVESYNSADSLSLTSETLELLKYFRYDWITDDSILIPDIAIIVSELFCLNGKALTVLKPYLFDLFPTIISIGKETFYSLSKIPVLENALNLKSSKIKYFSTGDIMEITKPVFKKQQYPNIFKVGEIGGSFFCSENFKNAIIANNVTGIIFKECKVKTKSWFI